jgi:NTP pyrophosphatase (non-canonical NTP hydrolase)
MTLNQLGQEAYDNAKAHGFYDDPPSVPERLCLIHSEVSEALEDFRDGKMDLSFEENGKPVGFPSELADSLIRIVDLAYYLGIDLDEAVKVKMAYNQTRPYRHGRKVL